MREMRNDEFIFKTLEEELQKKFLKGLPQFFPSKKFLIGPPIRPKPDIPRLPDMGVIGTIRYIYDKAENARELRKHVDKKRNEFLMKIKGSVKNKIKEFLNKHPEFNNIKSKETNHRKKTKLKRQSYQEETLKCSKFNWFSPPAILPKPIKIFERNK